MSECKYCRTFDCGKGDEGISGEHITIEPCANRINKSVTEALMLKGRGDEKAGIVIMSGVIAMGYFDVNYCPMCGRRLDKKEV